MEQLLTIKDLLNAYRDGRVTPRDMLFEKLNLAKNDTHNVWLSLVSDDMMERYLQSLSQYDVDELPLYGVPFAIKDNIDLAGLTTTAGCAEFAYQPDESAFVVELLMAAGAVPIGKTNLDQFATGLVGTRSPWGAVTNSFNPDYISGGSSSGSAVSVATNQVFFSLGTDTAGSGRVPAAFNNILGLKPTRGALSCRGVVPACRTLDCVSFFARTAQDLSVLQQVASIYDPKDSYSRVLDTASVPCFQSLSDVRIGVPKPDQLAFFGNQDYQRHFEQSVERWSALGANIVEFDLSPFLQAANLLYQGPWVAERYAAIQSFFDEHASACLPEIETIIGGATSLSAVETFKAMYQLQEFKVMCDERLNDVDVVITPTAGTTYTIEEIHADPISLNSQLGYYTNFMNLLDYSAIACPSSFMSNGLPFGFTLFAPAGYDQYLIELAAAWQNATCLPLGNIGKYDSEETMPLLVCGAHMSGLPLNHQLIELGGDFSECTQTSNDYRFYALAGGPPYRPGLVRDTQSGGKIDVEIWQLPIKSIGQLLAEIPHPLGLGSVELVNGEWVKGFICEPIATEGARDITHMKSWRRYMESV